MKQDTTRRGFLKVLGLGAAAAATGGLVKVGAAEVAEHEKAARDDLARHQRWVESLNRGDYGKMVPVVVCTGVEGWEGFDR